MTDEDNKIEKALRKCADVHLPDDFADRLVKRIRESRECEEKFTLDICYETHMIDGGCFWKLNCKI